MRTILAALALLGAGTDPRPGCGPGRDYLSLVRSVWRAGRHAQLRLCHLGAMPRRDQRQWWLLRAEPDVPAQRGNPGGVRQIAPVIRLEGFVMRTSLGVAIAVPLMLLIQADRASAQNYLGAPRAASRTGREAAGS
jgi:hypothetical protein